MKLKIEPVTCERFKFIFNKILLSDRIWILSFFHTSEILGYFELINYKGETVGILGLVGKGANRTPEAYIAIISEFQRSGYGRETIRVLSLCYSDLVFAVSNFNINGLKFFNQLVDKGLLFDLDGSDLTSISRYALGVKQE